MSARRQGRASGYLSGRRILYFLAAILLLGLALRSAYWLRHLHDFGIRGDALNYQIMSWQWVEDGIYGYALQRRSAAPNAYVTPAYPVMLSAIYALVNDPYLQITVTRVVQIILGTASVALGYLTVKRALGRADVALVTAFLMAVYPPYVQSTLHLLTEVLALATMLLYFFLQLVGLQRGSRAGNLGAGLAFAAHLLVRPVLLPLAPLPFVYALIKRGWRRWPEVMRAATWTALGTVALMLPWWTRNLIVLDAFILTSTGSANPFLAGTYPYLKGLLEDFSAGGYESDQQGWFARKRLREGFSREPLLYLRWYTLGKIDFTFRTPWLYEAFTPRPQIMELMRIGHLTLAWSGLAGLVVGTFRRGILRFSLIYLALFTALYLIFIPTTRYAYQLMFFLMVGAAYLACEAGALARAGLARAGLLKRQHGELEEGSTPVGR